MFRTKSLNLPALAKQEEIDYFSSKYFHHVLKSSYEVEQATLEINSEESVSD